MAKRKEGKNKVKVKVEIPIHRFGFFTYKEFSSTQKEVTKTESSPIYVFPRSTAALAQD